MISLPDGRHSSGKGRVGTQASYEEEQNILDTAAARTELRRIQSATSARYTSLPMPVRWQLEDAGCIALVLAIAASLSPGSAFRDAFRAPPIDHTLGSHAHHEPEYDLHVSLAICAVLIGVTILFEKCKHALEASVPRLMAGVLQALFGELTVLGFITLFAFGLMRSGVLRWLSIRLYGSPTHLIHLFETIHFLLFFVMMLFLLQAGILVHASLRFESLWLSVEAVVTDPHTTTGEPLHLGSMSRRARSTRRSFTPTAATLVALSKEPGRWYDGSCFLARWQQAEARDALRYALLRHRFLNPEGAAAAQMSSLPQDFDFSGYLRRRCALTTASILHVTPSTWGGVLVFIALLLELPLLHAPHIFQASQHAAHATDDALVHDGALSHDAAGTAHSRMLSAVEGEAVHPHATPLAATDSTAAVGLFGVLDFFGIDEMPRSVLLKLALGWAIWLLALALEHNLSSIVQQLTPGHPLLQWVPGDGSPTGRMLHPMRPPAVEGRSAVAGMSKHEQLFWGGRSGPAWLVFLMRLLSLTAAVSFALLLMSITSDAEHASLLLLSLAPVTHVIISAPRLCLPALVLATSVEQLKSNGSVQETLQEMSTERALRVMRTLSTLQSHALRWQARQRRAANSSAEACSGSSSSRGGSSGGGSSSRRACNRYRLPPASTATAATRTRAAPGIEEEEDAAEFGLHSTAVGSGDVPAEVVAELLEAFRLFDKDGSGRMDVAELQECMATLGVSLDRHELSNLHAEMDASHDGLVDFDEFCAALAPDRAETRLSPKQVASAIYATIDTEGRGSVTTGELRVALQRMNGELTAEDLASAMRIFDEDGSGEVSEQEFVRALETMKTFV